MILFGELIGSTTILLPTILLHLHSSNGFDFESEFYQIVKAYGEEILFISYRLNSVSPKCLYEAHAARNFLRNIFY